MTSQLVPFDDVELAAWFDLEVPEDSGSFEDPTESGFDEEYELACIARYERQIAALQGEQVVAMASFVDSYVRDYDTWYPEADPDHGRRSAYAEIALTLGIAERTSDSRVATAQDLVGRLPATVAALCAGRVTLPRARVILEETLQLGAEQLRTVEETLLPKAPALTPGNLRRSVRRLVEKIDSAALVRRKEAAKADRWVRWWDLPEGMAQLQAQLPAHEAAAVFGVIDELAHTAKTPEDPRTIEQLRADTFVDAILRPADQPDRVRHIVNVTVPASLLVGAPGIETVEQAAAALTGAGVDSELVASIAADAPWRRILTDPIDAHVLDAKPRRYKPSAALAEHIHTRDPHCRAPVCRQPARMDLDHTIPAESGGPTITRNLAALCRRHHRLKHAPGWECEQTEDGVLTFTTPSGRVFRTGPPAVDGEEYPTY